MLWFRSQSLVRAIQGVWRYGMVEICQEQLQPFVFYREAGQLWSCCKTHSDYVTWQIGYLSMPSHYRHDLRRKTEAGLFVSCDSDCRIRRAMDGRGQEEVVKRENELHQTLGYRMLHRQIFQPHIELSHRHT